MIREALSSYIVNVAILNIKLASDFLKAVHSKLVPDPLEAEIERELADIDSSANEVDEVDDERDDIDDEQIQSFLRRNEWVTNPETNRLYFSLISENNNLKRAVDNLRRKACRNKIRANRTSRHLADLEEWIKNNIADKSTLPDWAAMLPPITPFDPQNAVGRPLVDVHADSDEVSGDASDPAPPTPSDDQESVNQSC